jgi:hypothetical protein
LKLFKFYENLFLFFLQGDKEMTADDYKYVKILRTEEENNKGR